MYSYKIIKNEGEGIKGYGYTMQIFKDKKLVSNEGAFGGETQALEWLRIFIEGEIERFGLIEVVGIERL